jgi:large subunit ribosomal protein L14
LHGGSKKKAAFVGNFIKFSVKQVNFDSIIEKGFKSNGILLNTVFRLAKHDGSYLKLKQNALVMLKKRMTPRGKELLGLIPYAIKRKKFRTAFPGII